MGANTYIGNAPNFMVYAIAKDRKVADAELLRLHALVGAGYSSPLFIVQNLPVLLVDANGTGVILGRRAGVDREIFRQGGRNGSLLGHEMVRSSPTMTSGLEPKAAPGGTPSLIFAEKAGSSRSSVRARSLIRLSRDELVQRDIPA